MNYTLTKLTKDGAQTNKNQPIDYPWALTITRDPEDPTTTRTMFFKHKKTAISWLDAERERIENSKKYQTMSFS